MKSQKLVVLVLKIGWYLGKRSENEGEWSNTAKKCMNAIIGVDELSYSNNPEFNKLFKTMLGKEVFDKVK